MTDEKVSLDTMHKLDVAGRRLGLTESTMRKRIYLRQIEFYRVSKRAIRISEKTIQDILAKGHRPAVKA